MWGEEKWGSKDPTDHIILPLSTPYILCVLVTSFNQENMFVIIISRWKVFEQTQRYEKFHFYVVSEPWFCSGQLPPCINVNYTHKINIPFHRVLTRIASIYHHFFYDIIVYIRNNFISSRLHWKFRGQNKYRSGINCGSFIIDTLFSCYQLVSLIKKIGFGYQDTLDCICWTQTSTICCLLGLSKEF